MNKFLLIASAFGLLLSSASAQEGTSKEDWMTYGLKRSDYTRYVPSGTSRRIWFTTVLNPDCSVNNGLEIRTTKKPEHGTVEITSGEGFASYDKDNIRVKCNGKKYRGVSVTYKSSAGYVGPDEFEVLSLSPSGFGWEVHFRLDVR